MQRKKTHFIGLWYHALNSLNSASHPALSPISRYATNVQTLPSFPLLRKNPASRTENERSLFLLVYLDFFRILADIRMNRLLNQLTASTRNLQNQIVQRHTTQDIHMIR